MGVSLRLRFRALRPEPGVYRSLPAAGNSSGVVLKRLNQLIYADDLVLISPSTAGLEKLLDICHRFGIAHDSEYEVNDGYSEDNDTENRNFLDLDCFFRIHISSSQWKDIRFSTHTSCNGTLQQTYIG